MTEFQTPRTVVRPFTEDDARAAFAWFGDPVVMRYTRGADRDVEETRRRIAKYQDQQQRLGYSKWLVLERSTREPIGDAGLLMLDGVSPLPDLGYRLVRSRWGAGLGTELASAWVLAAFGFLDIEAVSAFAHVENSASLRVLEKVGFERTGRHLVMGIDAFTYVQRRKAPFRAQ